MRKEEKKRLGMGLELEASAYLFSFGLPDPISGVLISGFFSYFCLILFWDIVHCSVERFISFFMLIFDNLLFFGLFFFLSCVCFFLKMVFHVFWFTELGGTREKMKGTEDKIDFTGIVFGWVRFYTIYLGYFNHLLFYIVVVYIFRFTHQKCSLSI